MKIINGGVTAPKGFLANFVTCGIKQSKNPDLSILYSQVPCICAGTFTKNMVKSGSVTLCIERVKKGQSQAIIVNSGNANCCVGQDSLKAAEKITGDTAKTLSIKKDMVLMASTGVIGKPLPVDRISSHIGDLVKGMSSEKGRGFAKAIMTTDTVHKEIAAEINIGGKKIKIGAACKGAGMIHPNMATMLAFFTTDALIDKVFLNSLFKEVIDSSFNKISVDGDMSTNDTALIFANGMAGNKIIKKNTQAGAEFFKAVKLLASSLAKKMVLDGEGATKFVEIKVEGARSEKDADIVARSIANSNLVKTMIAGGDPNLGRIAASAGYSGVYLKENKMDIYFGNRLVMKNGSFTGTPRKLLLDIFKEKEIKITVDLNMGSKSGLMWTCDLTEEYVRINAEYET